MQTGTRAPARRIIDLTEVEFDQKLDARLAAFSTPASEPLDPARSLTRKQAAEFLAISLSQLDLLTRREVDPIPYRLAGECRRYPRLELISWQLRQGGAS